MGLVAVAGVILWAVSLTPVVLGAIGFTPTGIAAGSYAAGMMPYAAVANSNEVAAGSLVAVLQSAGMDFLSWAATKAVHVPRRPQQECAADKFSENKRLLTVVAIAAGAGIAVAAAPFVLGAIGFTSTGIAAGSSAAGMMSSAAIANGGGVAAGSLVAVLQSAGMAGLSGNAAAAFAIAGGLIGYLASPF